MEGGAWSAAVAGLAERTELQVKAANIGTAALLAIPAVIAPAQTLAAAKSVASFTVQKPVTAIALGAAASLGSGLLLSSPKSVETVMNAPSNLANFGSNIGKVIENPTIANIKTTLKENPYLSGATAALGVFGVGKVISTVVTGANVAAENANTEAINKAGQPTIIMQPGTNVAAPTLTPETKKAEVKSEKKTTTKKKKKAVKKKAKKKVKKKAKRKVYKKKKPVKKKRKKKK